MIVQVKEERGKIILTDKDNVTYQFKRVAKKDVLFQREIITFLKPSKKIKEGFLEDIKTYNFNRNKEKDLIKIIGEDYNFYKEYDYIFDVSNLPMFSDFENKLNYKEYESLKNNYSINKLKLKKIKPEYRSKLQDFHNGKPLSPEELEKIKVAIEIQPSELLAKLENKKVLLASFVLDDEFLNAYSILSNLFISFDCFLFIN